MFACLAPAPGARLLDIGSGTGDDVLELARRVGATGLVTGVDRSEILVQEGTRRAEHDGVANVEFRLGDARALPFEDHAFDAVYSQRTFQYLTDPLPAVREMVRVTRPGGRIVVADTDWETAVFGGSDAELTGASPGRGATPARAAGSATSSTACSAGPACTTCEVFPHTQVVTELDDFFSATLRLLAAQAVSSGAVTEADASRWHSDLGIASREHRFLRAFTMFVTAGHT